MPQAQGAVVGSSNGSQAQTRIAVLGASGYTGEEVVRLLALHPTFAVKVLTGETQAGKVSRKACSCALA
jgi:N-acetyl-gamma-glutamyl-phosphate reductase